jgi:hypothetical protein
MALKDSKEVPNEVKVVAWSGEPSNVADDGMFAAASASPSTNARIPEEVMNGMIPPGVAPSAIPGSLQHDNQTDIQALNPTTSANYHKEVALMQEVVNIANQALDHIREGFKASMANSGHIDAPDGQLYNRLQSKPSK